MPDTLIFLDADGVEHSLDHDEHFAQPGVAGRFMPPIDIAIEEVPGDGARVDNVRYGPREVPVPVFFGADTEVDTRSLLRQWARFLDPKRGNGRLRNVAEDGQQWELACRYTGGFELEETMELVGPRHARAVLVFQAFEDPLWMDVATNVATYSLSAGTQATFFPFFPLSLAGSEVVTEPAIDNTGDAEAWPIWDITGPGSNPLLRNQTTGETLDLSADGGVILGGGETITIDTRPGRKTIRLSDGTNLYPKKTDASSLWPLEVGANHLSLQLTDATVDSEIRLSYKRRRLVP